MVALNSVQEEQPIKIGGAGIVEILVQVTPVPVQSAGVAAAMDRWSAEQRHNGLFRQIDILARMSLCF